MKNPEERMDPWKEAIECYESIVDDIVIVGDKVNDEFKWSELGNMFDEAFIKCDGDWVINLQVDMFIHENDIKKLKNLIYNHPDEPAIALPKYKFFEPNRYEIKNFDTIIFNKKKFKNILFNGGGDLALPTLEGKILDQNSVACSNIPVWNYDTTFRTKEVIMKDRSRFARAWNREFGNFGERGGPTDEEAYLAWYEMVKSRYPLHVNKVDTSKHPKYIKEKLYNLTAEQFGYDLFGLKDNVSFSQLNKLKQKKIRYKYKLDSL